jgi:hypothetical protein
MPNFKLYFVHGMSGLAGKWWFRGLDKILAWVRKFSPGPHGRDARAYICLRFLGWAE